MGIPTIITGSGSLNHKTQKKDVEPVLSLVPPVETFALPPSNAENPTPNDIYKNVSSLHGAFPLLCF